ncbi:MAG: SGNH/GDSL hydrolase family protein [Balneolaceae bacterium]|nr:SGNH/GDSL hydrolase family protein [Balneolaceae bacterium]
MIKRTAAISLFCFFSISVSVVAQQNAYSYLALGDSYTIGEAVEESERWPVQLQKALAENGVMVSDPQIIAQTGWTTTDLRSAIENTELNPPYDLVSLLIGVNDQYQGIDIEEYPDNFRFLLNKAIELAGDRPDHVLVLSIPDYGATPFGKEHNPRVINRELKQYNTINRKISDELGVMYVDIFSASLKAVNNEELTASDDLHPSGAMYQLWVEEVMQVLLPEIQSW